MAKKLGKSKEPWYVRAFNADYLARYKHRSDEMAQAELPFVLRSLNPTEHATVLDLCCGAGRHSRTLISTLKKGRVIGLDLSSELLREAHAKNPDSKRLFFVRADMRRIPLATASVNGVANLFTSFGYFKTDREHLRVLQEVARILVPGGRFVIDFLNRDQVVPNLVKRSESEHDGCRIVETRRYDTRSKRIIKTIRISGSPHLESTTSTEIVRESIRAYNSMELKKLLTQAGLEPLSLHGDLSGESFSKNTSPRCVWVAEKKRPIRSHLGRLNFKL